MGLCVSPSAKASSPCMVDLNHFEFAAGVTNGLGGSYPTSKFIALRSQI